MFLRPRRGSDAARDVVVVKVITYAPTMFAHCQRCEVAFGEMGIGERVRREAAATALPEDLALDFARVSDWIRRIVERYGPRIHAQVIDAASIEGVVASVRYRAWRHPAVIVDGTLVAAADDFNTAEQLLDRAVARVEAVAA